MTGVDYDIYELDRKEKIMTGLALSAFLAAAGILFFRSAVFVLLYPVLIQRARDRYRNMCVEKRKRALLTQFKDLLYELSASFASSRQMEESLREAYQKLSSLHGEKAYITVEIDAMLRKLETGNTTGEVWEDFAERSHLPDISDFALVFRACRDTGGDIVTAINRGAKIISEKIGIENDIKNMMAEKRAEGNIITVMPVVIILFLGIASPGYLEPVYTTLSGRIIMFTALLLTAAAYKMIEGIMKIEI